MSPERVVVTGVGVVTAAGFGSEALARALAEGVPRLSEIDHFAPGPGEPSLAGQVEAFSARDWLPPMLVRQTDRSTHMAFAAARLGMEEAGLELGTCNPLRCGAMIGIGVGGMVFAEPQLYNQWVFGPDEVSTYQSIAWFYAAAMGQLSITLDLRGYSKTFVADRVSGLHALGHAFHTVREGRLDLCLAGGTEAPLAPFIYRSLASTGWLARDCYQPFSSAGQGFLLGEGAALMVLESLTHAEARGAPILAEITGFGMATDCRAMPYESASGAVIERSMRLALGADGNGAARSSASSQNGSSNGQREAVRPGGAAPPAGDHHVDLVVADGSARPQADASEAAALERLLGRHWQHTKVTAPKAIVGELYGAGAALEVAAAALAIRDQTVWPLATNGDARVPHTTSAHRCRVDSALVHSAGIRGLSSSLLVRRFQETSPSLEV